MFIGQIYCTEVHKSQFIEFKGIEKKEILHLEKYLDSLKSENQLLMVLLNELKVSEHQISIEFSNKVKIAGFVPKNDSVLLFRFRRISDFKDENILLEELFHAFQAHYYAADRMLPNEDGLIKGAPNIEYEARLTKAIMALYLDKTISETPSQRGLLEFALSLLNEKGKVHSLKLNPKQHEKYIDLVLHFQQHWKTRNKIENIKSVYAHPVDSLLGPEAFFYLLKKFNSH